MEEIFHARTGPENSPDECHHVYISLSSLADSHRWFVATCIPEGMC